MGEGGIVARILLEGIFEYDEVGMHSGDEDPEALEWFVEEILLGGGLQLWDHNEIGDSLGTFKVTGIHDAPVSV
jgi:hypothetical protein